MTGEPLRIAIVGCGVIGAIHAGAIERLSPRARVAVAVDTDVARASALAAVTAESLEDALGRADVDAVAICTPSGCHADQAVAALDAGKHVLVEKPIDVTLPAAQRLVDASRRTDRVVAVVSQHRFDAASAFVHAAAREGRLGRLTSAVATVPWWRGQEYYDSGGWRGTLALDGGGALMNQGIHALDLLLWMLGGPVEVFAWTDRLAHRGIEVEDTLVAAIRFASGAIAGLHATTAAYPGTGVRLQVLGDRGSAVIENDRLVYFHVADSAGASAPSYGAGADANQAPSLGLPSPSSAGARADPGALSDAHVDQYRDFLDAVAMRRPPLVTVDDAMRTLAAILAIYESAAAGAPIRVRTAQASGQVL